jgi:hypothetical protein
MAEMVPTAANRKQVISRYENLPDDIQSWLDGLPDLIKDFRWEISVAFVFMQIESMFHNSLYRGLVKIHKTDSQLTKQLLDRDHFSGGRIKELYKTIFGIPIPHEVYLHLDAAVKIRNRAIHGKKITQPEARQCLMEAFNFLEAFSTEVSKVAKFRPCSDGRGLKGAAEALSKDTSRWVLRGMGIPGSKNSEGADL